MKPHQCNPVYNEFSKAFTCSECNDPFDSVKKIKEEIYLDIYNLIIDEEFPLESSEGVCIYIKEKLKEIGKKLTLNKKIVLK